MSRLDLVLTIVEGTSATEKYTTIGIMVETCSKLLTTKTWKVAFWMRTVD